MNKQRIDVRGLKDMMKRLDLVVFEMNYLMEDLEDKMKHRELTDKEAAEYALLNHLMNLAKR